MTGTTAANFKKPSFQKPILEQYFNGNTSGQFIDNQDYLPLHVYPAADTVLLNHDGTIVEDDKNPENVFTIPNSNNKYGEKFTTPSMENQLSENQDNFGYIFGNNHIFPIKDSTKTESVTKGHIESSSGHISTQKPLRNTVSETQNPQWQELYTYVTQHPTQSNTQTQSDDDVTFVKYPNKPDMLTTSSFFYKKTDSQPPKLSPTTSHPKPSYIISEDNLVLLPTYTSSSGSSSSNNNNDKNKDNNNKTKKPVTKVPTDLTQVTSKKSSKPIFLSSTIPIRATTLPAFDPDDRYPSFSYDYYTGSSKPPIMISQPIGGLEDNNQAINHIIGILNSTYPKPEVVTTPGNTDSGLSTWVSIIGDDESNKKKRPKPGSTKPGTSTTVVHGPAFSVTPNQHKPAPTLVVISHDTTQSIQTAKPSKKPSRPTPTLNKFSTKTTTTTTKPTQFYENNVYHTGQENLINFPPVRNPDLNSTALNQMEKPTVVETYVSGQNEVIQLPNGIALEVVPDGTPLNGLEEEDEDYNDITTPSFHEEKVGSQVHLFVEKIVNSLSENFQDLEHVLFKNENKTSLTSSNGVQLNNVHVGEENDKYTTEGGNTILTTTRLPPRRSTTLRPEFDDTTIFETTIYTPTKRPTRLTTKKPSTNYLTTLPGIIIKKPTTLPSTITEPVKKPITISPTKKPTVTSIPTRKPISSTGTTTGTKKPTIITVTKRPTTVTTKRPTSILTTITTRRTTVTKKPKPTTTTTTTKRTTTTTTTTTEIPNVGSEGNLEDTEPEIESPPPVDFRRRKLNLTKNLKNFPHGGIIEITFFSVQNAAFDHW